MRVRTFRRRGTALAGVGLLAAALGGLVWSGSAAAQSQTGDLSENFGDWRVVCSTTQGGERVCATRQQVNRNGTERFLAMEVRRGDSGASGRLVLPFGMRFSEGITVQIDDNAALGRLAVQTCIPEGCIAGLPIDAETLGEMRRGSQIGLGMTSIGGETLRAPVSLKGFTAAYERLDALSGSG